VVKWDQVLLRALSLVFFTLSRSSWSRISHPLPNSPHSTLWTCKTDCWTESNEYFHYSTDPAHTDGPQVELDWWFIYFGPLPPEEKWEGLSFWRGDWLGLMKWDHSLIGGAGAVLLPFSPVLSSCPSLFVCSNHTLVLLAMEPYLIHFFHYWYEW